MDISWIGTIPNWLKALPVVSGFVIGYYKYYRPLLDQLQELGLIVLPYESFENRRIRNLARERKSKLISKFVLEKLTRPELIHAVLADIPPKRSLLQQILRDLYQHSSAVSIEIHANPGDGKSVFLTQLSVELSKRRLEVIPKFS